MTTFRLTNWGSGIQAADSIADNDYKKWQKARNTAEPTLCFLCGMEYPISDVLYAQVTNVLETQENMDFLLKITVEDLEKMVGIVRERLES